MFYFIIPSKICKILIKSLRKKYIIVKKYKSLNAKENLPKKI